MKKTKVETAYKTKLLLENKIEILENKIRTLNQNIEIEERWMALIGPGHGYFCDWFLKNEFIIISYEDRCGDHNSDRIPVKFFNSSNEKKSVLEFTEYLNQIKRNKREKEDKKRNTEEIKLMHKLMKKHLIVPEGVEKTSSKPKSNTFLKSERESLK